MAGNEVLHNQLLSLVCVCCSVLFLCMEKTTMCIKRPYLILMTLAAKEYTKILHLSFEILIETDNLRGALHQLIISWGVASSG